MNPAIVLGERLERKLSQKTVPTIGLPSGNPTLLIATVDTEIRDGLTNLLEAFSVNAIWVGSVADVKSLISREKILACLCGFWLQDGTYREVVRTLRHERINIPAIIVSAPACPQEYGDYIAAMNIGALDFLRFPYQRPDFERMLESAIDRYFQSSSTENLKFQQRGAA